MDFIPCQRDKGHTGVWACACESGGTFCSLCILEHMSSAGQPHPVSPLGPTGQLMCWRCHGQPLESVRFKYDVCLCASCAVRLPVWQETYARTPTPETELKLPPRPEDGDPEVSSEDCLRRGTEGSRSLLQRLFADKRNDIHRSLRRAYDNMNSLDDIMQEALTLESQLCESRAEVQRLQLRLAESARIEAAQLAGMQTFLDRVETVSRESEVLKTQNAALLVQVQQLTEKLKSAEELLVKKDRMQEHLSAKIDAAVDTLQVSIRENTTEAVKLTAQKVADVMPFLAHIELDNTWLDSESTEKFLRLASARINDWVDCECMQEVARFCVQVARFLGPHRLLAVFAEQVTKKLCESEEEGMKLVRALRTVFEKTKGQETAKEVLEGLLKLLEGEASAFYDSATIVSHLSALLPPPSLCEFAISASAFFSTPRSDTIEWKRCLLSLPVDWSQHRDAAQQCLCEFLKNASARDFDGSFLELAKLMKAGEVVDPLQLFTLITKLGKALQNRSVTSSLRSLIGQLLAFLQHAASHPEAHSRVLTSFAALRHLLHEKEARPQDIQQLATLLDVLRTDDQIAGVAETLVEVMEEVKSEDTVAQLGFATVNWMLPCGQVRSSLSFVQWLLSALSQSDRSSLDSTARRVAKVLSDLSQIHGEAMEATVRSLVERNLPLPKVCALASALATELWADHLNFVVQVLRQVVDAVSQPVADEWVELTEASVRGRSGLVLKTYQAYSELVRRGVSSESAAELGKEFLSAFQSFGDPTALRTMLDEALRVLATDGVRHSLVTRICALWSRSKRVLSLDPRPINLSTLLLQSLLSHSQIEPLLAKLESALDSGELSTVVFSLADVYVGCAGEVPAKAQRFIMNALESLKQMQPIGQETKGGLEALALKAQTRLRDSRESVLLFLEAACHLCVVRKASVESLLAGFSQLLDGMDSLALVKSLSQLKDFEYCVRVLELATPGIEVAGALRKVVELAKYLEGRGVALPPITSELGEALIQRPTEVATLLDASSALIEKNDYFKQYPLVYQLLQELSVRTRECLPLLCFVPKFSSCLLDSHTAPSLLAHFSNLVLRSLNTPSSFQALDKLRRKWRRSLIPRCAEILARDQDRVTAEIVNELLPPQKPTPQRLAHVQSGTVRLFNFQNSVWEDAGALSEQIKVTSNSSWTFLDDDQLFSCGGMHHSAEGTWNEAYTFARSGRTWTVTALPNMLTARSSHGLIYICDTVFVFGGYSERYAVVKQCEKFCFTQSRSWQALPDMTQARNCFNPCLFYDLVYLCGHNSTLIETFAPATSVLTQLAITLPENANSCLYVEDDELVVHSSQFILRLALDEFDQAIEVRRSAAPGVNKFQNSQPVVDSVRRLVYMSQKGKCLVFSMDSGAVVTTVA